MIAGTYLGSKQLKKKLHITRTIATQVLNLSPKSTIAIKILKMSTIMKVIYILVLYQIFTLKSTQETDSLPDPEDTHENTGGDTYTNFYSDPSSNNNHITCSADYDQSQHSEEAYLNAAIKSTCDIWDPNTPPSALDADYCSNWRHIQKELNRTRELYGRPFFNEDIIKIACCSSRGYERLEYLEQSHLSFCDNYAVPSLFTNFVREQVLHGEPEKCRDLLMEFYKLNEIISRFHSMFLNLLKRFNCKHEYSKKWNCNDCRDAYKDWICSSHLSFYIDSLWLVKPCISFCQRVEQRCPYLHPTTKEQYGGQPVFICQDPDIPFVPEITPEIPYSDPPLCYDLCHISRDKIEYSEDTLSRYSQESCSIGLLKEAHAKTHIVIEPNKNTNGSEQDLLHRKACREFVKQEAIHIKSSECCGRTITKENAHN